MKITIRTQNNGKNKSTHRDIANNNIHTNIYLNQARSHVW